VNGQITASAYEIAPLLIDAVISPSAAQGYGLFAGIEGTVDTTILGIFVPGIEGGEQVLGRIKVVLGGREIWSWRILSFFEVTEADDGAVSWSFGVPYFNQAETDETLYDDPDEGFMTLYSHFFDPLRPSAATTGSISHYHGPPPGGLSVNISISIPSATGTQEYPLVTDGLAENAELTYGEDGVTMIINGTGPMQRLDRKAISVEIPAGHGMTLGEMVTWVMEETRDQNADDWTYSLPTIPTFFVVDENGTLDERNRYKLIQATDRPGIDLAQELLEIVGHRLVLDRQGEWLLNRTFDDGGTAAWSYHIKQLLSVEGFSMQPNADGPPVVVFTGAEQEVVDDVDGLITKRTEVFVTGVHTRIRPESYISDTSGGLTGTGFVDYEVDGIFYYERNDHTYQGDTLVKRASTYRQQNVNPEYRAGEINNASTGAITYTTGLYLYADEGYVSLNASGVRWADYQYEVEDFVYEDLFDDGRMFLSRKVVKKYFRYNPREATQNNDGTWRTSVYVLWDGEGVQYTADSWFADKPSLYSAETIVYTINEDGFVEQETKTMEGANYLPPGTLYWFADGRTSSLATEDWGTLWAERTIYSVEGDQHTETTTRHEHGRIIKTTVERGEGYLPAASMMSSVKPDELADGTPLPNSKWASPNDTNGFEVTYEDAELLKHRPRWEDRISNEIVADEDEGMTYAKRYLRELATIPILFSIPYNPLIRTTDWIEIDLGRVGDNSFGTIEAKVTVATHRYDPENGSVTSIEAKVFAV